MQTQAQRFAIPFPTPVETILVFALCRVTRPRTGLNVVPPHIFGAFAVGPQVLARHRTGMAADALIQVKEHTHMSANVHGYSLWLKFGRLDATHEDKCVAVVTGGTP